MKQTVAGRRFLPPDCEEATTLCYRAMEFHHGNAVSPYAKGRQRQTRLARKALSAGMHLAKMQEIIEKRQGGHSIGGHDLSKHQLPED